MLPGRLNVLILGGTQFVGRHIVEAIYAAGHRVTIFNRGQTPAEVPAGIERLIGDRDRGKAGLQSLGDRSWDACVDVSGYTPRQVRPSAERLAPSIGRYVYLSAVSVYGDPEEAPVTEAFPRTPPADEGVTEIDAETYGPLKVACENIVEEIFGERCALLRPQIVAGPFDPLDRLSYWVRRAGEPGPMLAPGAGSDYLQFIDARDLARFTVKVLENDLAGPFNLAGPRLMWSEFLNLLEARDLVWVSADILRAGGLTERDLPLYRPTGGPRSRLMHVSHERATQAGLTLTPPEITIRDTREWLRENPMPPALSPEREAEFLQRASRHC